MFKDTKRLEIDFIVEFRQPTDDFIKGENPWLELRNDNRRIVIDKIAYIEEISIDIFKGWIKEIGKASLYILFTIGKFDSKTISYILSNREIKNKVILVSAGLDKNHAVGIKPLIYDFSFNKNTLLPTVFKRLGIPYQYAHCIPCGKRIIVVCSRCGHLLCDDHFTSCAICKRYFCHPDLDRECLYKHKCR